MSNTDLALAAAYELQRDEVIPPAPPALSGQRMSLVSVQQQHHEFLYQLATSESMGFRWRFRGQVPNFEVFLHLLWQDVLAQFVVVETCNGRPVGYVVSYGADLRSGFTYIAQVMDEKVVGSGLGIEAGALFVNYLFTTWNFRKIYGEVPAYNFAAFQSGAGGFFKVEGVLRQHHYYGGRFWDQFLIAVYREEWEHLIPHFLRTGDRSAG